MSPKRFAVTALVIGASATMFGCAAQGSSRELRDAHRAMDEAYGTPMVKNAPAELTEAEVAMARAEQMQREHPGSLEARDAAYVAMRMAERARVAALYAADAQALDQAEESANRLYRNVAKRDDEAKVRSAIEHTERDERVAERSQLRSAVERVVADGGVVHSAGRETSVGLPIASLFVAKSAVLTPKGKAQLADLASAMRTGPKVDVRVRVLQQETAIGADSALLARHRAERVVQALREAGYQSDYLEVPESRVGSEQRVDLLMTEQPISASLPEPSAAR